jgi:transcriptional regulator with XRE-family HTH domain
MSMVRRHQTYVIYEARGGMTGFIEFAGRFVNLNKMADVEGLDYNYLWRIFHRNRQPSLSYAKRIAECLGMSYLDFLAQLAKFQESQPQPEQVAS